MSATYLHNGTWKSESDGLDLRNRSFSFGDGFFESIRVMDGKPLFTAHHVSRALETSAALKMIAPEHFNVEWLNAQCVALAERNGIASGGRIRMTVGRTPGGFYLPESNQWDLVLSISPYPDNLFTLNAEGKDIDIYPEIKKAIHGLSIYKTLNCNVYIMAALHAQERGWDDALIQNYRSAIIESSSANLFLVSNGVLYTPGLEDGCLAGTMRMNVINLAIEHGIKVYECTLNPQNLLVADEIFLTNAIRGIQWVSSYRTKRYFSNTSKLLVDMLNAKAKEDLDSTVA